MLLRYSCGQLSEHKHCHQGYSIGPSSSCKHASPAVFLLHRPKCHAPRCLPDVILYRSFTRSSTALAVIPGLGMRLGYCIECFHMMSLPSRLRRKKENSHHVGVQRDRSFYGDLHKRSDILLVILICVE